MRVNENGFSLISTLVSVAIVAVGALSLSAVMTNSYAAMFRQQRIFEANDMSTLTKVVFTSSIGCDQNLKGLRIDVSNLPAGTSAASQKGKQSSKEVPSLKLEKLLVPGGDTIDFNKKAASGKSGVQVVGLQFTPVSSLGNGNVLGRVELDFDLGSGLAGPNLVRRNFNMAVHINSSGVIESCTTEDVLSYLASVPNCSEGEFAVGISNGKINCQAAGGKKSVPVSANCEPGSTAQVGSKTSTCSQDGRKWCPSILAPDGTQSLDQGCLNSPDYKGIVSCTPGKLANNKTQMCSSDGRSWCKPWPTKTNLPPPDCTSPNFIEL